MDFNPSVGPYVKAMNEYVNNPTFQSLQTLEAITEAARETEVAQGHIGLISFISQEVLKELRAQISANPPRLIAAKLQYQHDLVQKIAQKAEALQLVIIPRQAPQQAPRQALLAVPAPAPAPVVRQQNISTVLVNLNQPFVKISVNGKHIYVNFQPKNTIATATPVRFFLKCSL